MPTEQDKEFYLIRAQQERLYADQCTSETIAKLHLTLADEYEHKAQGESLDYLPMIVVPPPPRSSSE